MANHSVMCCKIVDVWAAVCSNAGKVLPPDQLQDWQIAKQPWRAFSLRLSPQERNETSMQLVCRLQLAKELPLARLVSLSQSFAKLRVPWTDRTWITCIAASLCQDRQNCEFAVQLAVREPLPPKAHWTHVELTSKFTVMLQSLKTLVRGSGSVVVEFGNKPNAGGE